MKIDFSECNHCGEGLFSDFAKYKTVDKYLESIVAWYNATVDNIGPRPGFLPLNCAVKNIKTGSYRWIVRDGQVMPDADKHLRWLKRLPSSLRQFMSDDIKIRGDGFERELFFSWN